MGWGVECGSKIAGRGADLKLELRKDWADHMAVGHSGWGIGVCVCLTRLLIVLEGAELLGGSQSHGLGTGMQLQNCR